jgi:CTP:molybdopterin cytidylyltransferase MocA
MTIQIFGIILAAGNSSRLGFPKQNVVLSGGTTALAHSSKQMLLAGVSHQTVVLGGNSCEVIQKNRALFLGSQGNSCESTVQYKICENWQNGMAESLLCAFEGFKNEVFQNENNYFMVTLCDNPSITVSFLNHFIESFFAFQKKSSKNCIATTVLNALGQQTTQPPILLSASFALVLKKEIENNTLNKLKIKGFLQTAMLAFNANCLTVPFNEEWFDLDTPTDVKQAQVFFGRRL